MSSPRPCPMPTSMPWSASSTWRRRSGCCPAQARGRWRPCRRSGCGRIAVSDGPIGVRGGTDTELDPSVALPSGSALAATWDADLLGAPAACSAGEARRKGVDVVLGPTDQPAPLPAAAAGTSSASREDPLLTGRLATAYVRGRPGRRRRRHRQALRRQRRRDRPLHRRQPGRRAHAARAVPGALRGRRRRRPRLVRHGRLQRGQRRTDDRERPARRAAEGRVGLRRRRRLRLDGARYHGEPRRAPPRPGHARPGAGVGRAARRGGAGRRGRRGGVDDKVRRHAAARRPRRRPGRRRAGRRRARGRPIEDAAALAREAAAAASCCCATTASLPAAAAGADAASPCIGAAARMPACSAAAPPPSAPTTSSPRSTASPPPSAAGRGASPPSARPVRRARAPTRADELSGPDGRSRGRAPLAGRATAPSSAEQRRRRPSTISGLLGEASRDGGRRARGAPPASPPRGRRWHLGIDGLGAFTLAVDGGPCCDDVRASAEGDDVARGLRAAPPQTTRSRSR